MLYLFNTHKISFLQLCYDSHLKTPKYIQLIYLPCNVNSSHNFILTAVLQSLSCFSIPLFQFTGHSIPFHSHQCNAGIKSEFYCVHVFVIERLQQHALTQATLLRPTNQGRFSTHGIVCFLTFKVLAKKAIYTQAQS
jgi:hypothetical protein